MWSGPNIVMAVDFTLQEIMNVFLKVIKEEEYLTVHISSSKVMYYLDY